MEYFQSFIVSMGHMPWLFALVAFGLILLFLPVAEEVIIFTTAYLSAKQGGGGWLPSLLACIAGMVITDYYYYLIFRLFGRRLLGTRFFRWLLPPAKLEVFREVVRCKGAWVVFVVRFIPGGVRNVVFSACGLAGLSHRKFLLASLAGATLVVQVSFWTGYFLSEYLPPVEQLLEIIVRNARLLLGVLFLLLLAWHLFSKFRAARAGR